MCLSFYIPVQNGQTPLYIASCKGHDEVAKVLLKKNADLLICTEVASYDIMSLKSCILNNFGYRMAQLHLWQHHIWDMLMLCKH